MIHRFLVTCSFICCALVIASFAAFAVDQVSGASSQQVAQINSGSPTPAGGATTATHHSGLRRFVDRASTDLTYPIHSLLPSGSEWADQLLLLVFGLMVYGVGLGYLSRYTAGMS